jgi:hypothetical protein
MIIKDDKQDNKTNNIHTMSIRKYIYFFFYFSSFRIIDYAFRNKYTKISIIILK